MTLLQRLKPLSSPFLSRLFSKKEVDAEVIQPAETESVTPPALLPGMLERVTGTDEHSKLSDHLIAAQETTVTHAPVLRRILRNALVHRTGYFTWTSHERYANYAWLSSFSGRTINVDEIRYCLNYVSWRYFGHWLTDSIPTSLIDPDIGQPWIPPSHSWTHAGEYMKLFNLPQFHFPFVHAKHLVVYQDFSQGTSKVARYEIMRKKLHLKFKKKQAQHGVYLRRGSTGVSREIVNEQAVIERLDAQGWKIIDIATASLEELQTAICNTEVVVGIDGSHLDHAHVALEAAGKMIVLCPADRFSTRQIGLCRAHGVSIGMVVLKRVSDKGYYLDYEELIRTLEIMGG